MTPLELARKARVDLNTAYRWLWLGKIKARKVQGRWLIMRIDAESFLKERAVKRSATGPAAYGQAGSDNHETG